MPPNSDDLQGGYWEQDHGFRSYDHPVVRAFALQRIDFIRTWLNPSEIKRALDVGCGSGASTYYMTPHVPDVWGVDQSRRMLDRHPLRDCGKLRAAQAYELPFADGSFDLVYSWEALHHMDQPDKAVAEMSRVSRRFVLIAEPNRYNPLQAAFALWDREHRGVLRYSLGYMKKMLISANLQVLRSGAGGWIFPNKTPQWMACVLAKAPYRCFFGISNWVLGEKFG